MEEAQSQEAAAPDVGTDVPFDDAALAAEIENFRDEPQEEEPADPALAAATEEPAEAAATEETEEPTAEAAADGEPQAAEESAPSELDEKLDQIARQEAAGKKRVDEYMEQERAKFQKEMAEWQGKIEEMRQEATSLDDLKRRARYDLPSVAAELGIDLTEDGEALARQFYSMSKAAADNPQAKEQARATMREREMATKLSATEKRLEELTKRLDTQAETERTQKQAAEYISGVQRLADSEQYPLVKHLIDSEPEEADNMLRVVAARLMDANPAAAIPEPAAVLAELEKEQKATRERMAKRYGFTSAPPPAAETSAAPKTESPAPAKEQAAMETSTPNNNSPQAAAADLDDDELDDLLMKELTEKGFFSS